MYIRNRKSRRRVFFSVREAAWILNVPVSTVSRAIRVGALSAIPRRGAVVIPDRALVRQLGTPAENDSILGGAA
jgi:hypothetical protein